VQSELLKERKTIKTSVSLMKMTFEFVKKNITQVPEKQKSSP